MQTKMGAVSTLPSPEEALTIMKDSFSFQIQSEDVDLLDAKGRTLAEDVEASEYLPVFNRSAMDGYSVIAADTNGASKDNPVILKLAGEVPMGMPATEPLQAGTCVYTPTGAAVPEGTESVVMVEDTKKNDDGTISFFKETEANKNVILKGDDVYPGKKILSKGRVLTVADIGALAVLGLTKVKCAKKPVVGILSTGDELIDISETPKPGQVRDINSATLALLIEEFGGTAKRYGVVKDEKETLKNKILEANAECDMVLVSGGSSMGEKDATEEIIDELGTLILHGVRMKPGKPTILGNVNGKPVLGIPGNPISAFFITRIFVSPLLLKMLGAEKEDIAIDAVLSKDSKANKKRILFEFAKLSEKDGTTFAETVRMQSGLMTSIAGCDAFFSTPSDQDGRKAGDKVSLRLL